VLGGDGGEVCIADSPILVVNRRNASSTTQAKRIVSAPASVPSSHLRDRSRRASLSFTA
jgi:hypothetical protein